MFNVSWLSVGWISGGNLMVLGWYDDLGFGQNMKFLLLGCRLTYGLLIRIGQNWVCLQNLHSLRLFFWLNRVITMIIHHDLAVHSIDHLPGLYHLTKYKTFGIHFDNVMPLKCIFKYGLKLLNFYCSSNIFFIFVSEMLWIQLS